MPTRLIVDEHAFSLAPDGWHYYRALVAEHEKRPEIDLQGSLFFRFFQDERVRSVRYLDDLLFFHDPEKRSCPQGREFYLGTYPWGGWSASENLVGGLPFGHHYDRLENKSTRDLWGYGRNPWYEPSDRYPLEVEWSLTTKLYHSIKRGYHPLRYRNFPDVTLLIRRNGEMRGVMGNGHHRLAILAHLGRDKVTATLPPDWVGVVKETEVDQWYYVKNGCCSRERALEIFGAFFELNGRERIEYLGLPTVY
jgi:hypothetical protein